MDSARIQSPWMASSEQAAVPAVEMNVQVPLLLESPSPAPRQSSDADKLGIGERAFSAAGAAFLSAIIVNPLDVAKVQLQKPLPFLLTFYLFIFLVYEVRENGREREFGCCY